jgi:hypothetical protein
MNESLSNARYANNIAGQTAEAERAIPAAMTELASAVGDLETAMRALGGRISPLLPSGNPYERAEKVGENNALPAPRPVRSHLCDQLHTRIHELRGVTVNLQQMLKGIEI